MSHEPFIKDSDVIDGLNIKYLKFFGLWKVINDYRTTGNRNLFIKFKVFLTLFLAVPYVLCQYICYFFIKADLQKATILNLHSLPALHICWKILIFWLRMDSQCRLLGLVRKDFIKVPKEKREAAKEIYEKITKTANLFCVAAFILDSSVIIIAILFPGVSVDYILYHTGNVFDVTTGRKKILAGWYPLPINESPYYEMVLVYEAVLVGWGGMMLAVYDSLVCQSLMSLYAQYKVLGYHVSTLKIDSHSRRTKNGENNDSEMLKELKVILQDHQRLLRYYIEIFSYPAFSSSPILLAP
nr:uncharacterized protein LOC106693004 [Halyomorpha halys]